ncbi:MAG: hypothetical protein SGI97_09585 [candidate division Zixibacteria bacterium]|nr:hypothetical protein [candidate division Zixibacteria bacterium]
MTNGATVAAHAHAIANAIKAMGAIVKVEPAEFQKILNKVDMPVVITATSWQFGTKYKYMTSYKGFIFYTKTSAPMSLGGKIEVIAAQSIWSPQ